MARQSDPTREAPISFRPGKLRAAIRQRAVRTITEGQIVKRDLGRYYLLVGQALGDVRLTKSEGRWLACTEFDQAVEDHLSGNPFIPEHVNPSDYLLSVVKRAIFQAERQGKPAPSIAYQVADKVERLTPLQRAAVVDALDRLPSESEENIRDLNNWMLIGFPLIDDPLTADELVSEKGPGS